MPSISTYTLSIRRLQYTILLIQASLQNLNHSMLFSGSKLLKWNTNVIIQQKSSSLLRLSGFVPWNHWRLSCELQPNIKKVNKEKKRDKLSNSFFCVCDYLYFGWNKTWHNTLTPYNIQGCKKPPAEKLRRILVIWPINYSARRLISTLPADAWLAARLLPKTRLFDSLAILVPNCTYK